jgi:hypothetical protein
LATWAIPAGVSWCLVTIRPPSVGTSHSRVSDWLVDHTGCHQLDVFLTAEKERVKRVANPPTIPEDSCALEKNMAPMQPLLR